MVFYAEYYSSTPACHASIVVGPRDTLDFETGHSHQCTACQKPHEFLRTRTYTAPTPGQDKLLRKLWEAQGQDIIAK